MTAVPQLTTIRFDRMSRQWLTHCQICGSLGGYRRFRTADQVRIAHEEIHDDDRAD